VQLGLIGLGKMGGNMAERLRRDGHHVVGYDRNPDSPRNVASAAELVAALRAPRVIWVMVPSGEPTRATIAELGEVLDVGDIIIDGGNSRYTDDQINAEALAAKGIGYIDAGVSGGVWGLSEGYALMVGGDAESVHTAQPIFDSLKPTGDGGFVHAGPGGGGALREDGP
jgi:6-phosphogluconate dehydrogenase